MSMTVNGLKAAIIAELDARTPTGTAAGGYDGDTWRDDFAEAVATAVINYIQANAVVVLPGGQTVTHAMGPGVTDPYTSPSGAVQ